MPPPRPAIWQSGSWALVLGAAAIACVAFYRKGYDDGARATADRLFEQSQIVLKASAPAPPPEDEPTTSPAGTSRPSPSP